VVALLAVIYQGLKVVNDATDAQAARAREQALQELGDAQDLPARIAATRKVRPLWGTHGAWASQQLVHRQ
jgi:hypothetical protein